MVENLAENIPVFFSETGRPLDSIYSVYPVEWKGSTNAIELRRHENYLQDPEFQTYPTINELNGRWTPVNPGQTILFKAYMYAENQTSDDTDHLRGAQIVLDLYSSQARICEITTPDGTPTFDPATGTEVAGREGCNVMRGSNRWIQRKIQFVVQQSYKADGYAGHSRGEPHVPRGFIPIFLNRTKKQADESGRVWIANPELYVLNPEDTTPVTPTPYYPPDEPEPTPEPPAMPTAWRMTFGGTGTFEETTLNALYRLREKILPGYVHRLLHPFI